MLYVFHVDTGRMLTFDMRLAVKSVLSLQEQIEIVCKIPVDKQVLLASGGECLDPNAKVCTYSAGTDTNPIFLFSKCLDESPVQSTDAPCTSDIDTLNEIFVEEMKERVRESQDLPPIYQTVVVRCQIASQFYELAKEQTKICEQLVHDQHLQKQGWSAVIANLEDITLDITKRAEAFDKNYAEYLEEHEAYKKLVESFDEDLKVLGQIPILPALLVSEGTAECDLETSCAKKLPEEKDLTVVKPVFTTLLDWIASSDKSSMEQLFKNCTEGLAKYDDKMFKALQAEIQNILLMIDNQEMKEVKGIGDRLFGLDKLLSSAKKYVQEQTDLAQSFQQNQARAGDLGDTSILPDLCASHRKQLVVMLHNHQNICDIRRRCSKAKEELSDNIYYRLKWIMYIESSILELSQKLIIHSANIKRLRRQFDVLRQIHLAPTIYIASVSEVVRRRAFSQAFLLFASDMACQLLTIYNDEVTRRKDFQSQFEGHFLNSLFPGMEDMPSSYATQAPSVFDSGLPKLTIDDVLKLKEDLPMLTENLIVPDNVAAPVFPMIKYKNEGDRVDEAVAVEEKLVQVVSEAGLASNLDQNFLKPVESEAVAPTTAHGLPHLRDLDKGCESETDTEEFEKVGQSPLDLNFDKDIPSPKPSKQDASTCTEVGERSPVPPKKPPRSFQKLQIHHEESIALHRTLSISSSNTDSFTNVKIDTDSCFNSHHQQFLRSKSLSPHTPQSPREGEYLTSPTNIQGHQPVNEFVTDEFYIDESLPSSLSIETGHSHGEFVRQLDTANNVVAMLQDNLETSRTEQDKLKSFLIQLADLSRENITLLRTELKELHVQVQDSKSGLQLNFQDFHNAFQELLVARDRKEQELVQRLTADHEIEIADHKLAHEQKDTEINCLKMENVRLEESFKKSADECESLRMQLENNERRLEELERRVKEVLEEKEKAVKETAEQLHERHKAEIETIRSRFKLMMSDRSPSESSLEKFDFRDESVAKYSKAEVDEAVTQEMKKWQRKVEEIQIQHEIFLEDLRRQVSDEKDKQIVMLQERVANLNLECMKHKNTIQQLAESDFQCQNSELLRKIDLLEREKFDLQAEMEKLKQQELVTSVAVVEGKVDAATSPVKHKDRLSKSQTSALRPCSVSLNTCKVGELVLVAWNQQHENYIVHQESKYMFFLHSDCVEPLGLKVTANEQRKTYCIGEVFDKEYCHARKADNRFRVPKGTRFYRVKVKPVKLQERETESSSSQTSQMTQSQINTDSSGVQDVQLSCSTASHSVPATPTRVNPSVVESSTTTLQESRMYESAATSVVYESSLESLTEVGR